MLLTLARIDTKDTGMTTPIEEIRSAIQARHDLDGGGPFEGIAPFLADKVVCVHEPVFPSDGAIDGAALAKSLPLEHEMFDAAIANRSMDVTFTIRGDDEIVMQGFLTGTLRHDGSELRHPVEVVWTIADGEIVRAWIDASTPEIQDGYRRLAEAHDTPEVRPFHDKLVVALGVDPFGVRPATRDGDGRH